MATNFPGSADTDSTVGGNATDNPASGDATDTPSHSELHQNAGDAVQALEGKLGTGASDAAADQVLTGTGSGTSAWGAVPTPWTAWTPGTYGITVGDGTQTANYTVVGDLAFWEYRFLLGSTSAVTGEVRLTMPATMNDFNIGGVSGDVMFENADGSDYVGHVFRLNTTTVRLRYGDAAGDSNHLRSADLSATVPMTWASGDSMNAKGWFRKA
jgi:hypothetical protein